MFKIKHQRFTFDEQVDLEVPARRFLVAMGGQEMAGKGGRGA
jgi:hypothetical protein